MKKDRSSFTAASTMPTKIITDSGLIKDITNHNIKPIHIQINPTNKCPYDCSFCSCANRDKSKKYDLEKFKKVLDRFEKLGTEAVTITGGGDPLAYEHFGELIDYILNEKKMEGAMVTNGFLFSKYKEDEVIKNINKLTWCRISVYDEYPFHQKKIEPVISKCPDVDWAFSYVVTEKYDYKNLVKCIEFANQYQDRFSHIRVVSDILNEKVELGDVKEQLKADGVDTTLCLWQGRKGYKKGNKNCRISLLKPNIDPEGKIMPCCGVQYAVDDKIRDFDNRLSMGNVFNGDDLEKIYKEQKGFDGSICNKCYYNDYNDTIETIWSHDNITHKKFI